MRAKKAQIALESVIMYGFVLLVIMLFILFLFGLGILDFNIFFPDKCALAKGFICKNYAVYPDGAAIEIQNDLGKSLESFTITITDPDGGNLIWDCTPTTYSKPLLNGETSSPIKIYCEVRPHARKKIDGKIEIIYKLRDSTLELETTGEIMTPMDNKGSVGDPVCGDGILDNREECDEGSSNGAACSPDYESSCKYCTSSCRNAIVQGARCGDNLVEPGWEECDGASGVGQYQECDSGCNLIYLPYCGDENIQPGEECDYGLNNGNACMPSYGGSCAYCSSGCSIVTLDGGSCGDGIYDRSTEECDDGNSNDLDICTNSCIYESCRDPLLQTTQVINLQFPLSPNGSCTWPNGISDGKLMDHVIDTLDIPIGQGKRICDIEINMPVQNFEYDDQVYFILNDIVILTSFRTSYDMFASTGNLKIWDWNKIFTFPFSAGEGTKCPGDNLFGAEKSQCVLPPTQTIGSAYVTFGDSTRREIADRVKDTEATLSIVATGDNDMSLDCYHTPIAMALTLKLGDKVQP